MTEKRVTGNSTPVTRWPGVVYFPGDDPMPVEDEDTSGEDIIRSADRQHFSVLETRMRLEMRAMRREQVMLREQMKTGHDEIKELIGHISEDGKGGTGIFGNIARLTGRVDLLYSYRSIGVGIVMAVTALGGLFVWALHVIFPKWI